MTFWSLVHTKLQLIKHFNPHCPNIRTSHPTGPHIILLNSAAVKPYRQLLNYCEHTNDHKIATGLKCGSNLNKCTTHIGILSPELSFRRTKSKAEGWTRSSRHNTGSLSTMRCFTILDTYLNRMAQTR